MFGFQKTISVPIVGMYQHNESALKDILGNANSVQIELILKPEPNNVHDSNAIAAFTLDELMVGYVSREATPKLTGKIAASGIKVDALLEGPELSRSEKKGI